jgi:hypothetical protein
MMYMYNAVEKWADTLDSRTGAVRTRWGITVANIMLCQLRILNGKNECASLTDEQIIETIQQVKNDDEEDEEESDPPSPHLNLQKIG